MRLGVFAVLGLCLSAQTISAAPIAPDDWISLGSRPGVNGPINHAILDDQGRLIVGGDFTLAGTVEVSDVAMWDGSAWHAVGRPTVLDGGRRERVRRLGFDENGHLLALIKDYDHSGPYGLSRWDGASWELLGQWSSRSYDGSVRQMVIGRDSSVYLRAGLGYDAKLYKAEAGNLSSFTRLGDSFGALVRDFAVAPGGRVVAVGQFTSTGAGELAMGVALWNGSAWGSMGEMLEIYPDSPTRFTGDAAAVSPTGEVVVSGYTEAGVIHRWNGVSWNTEAPRASPDGWEWSGLTFLKDGSLAMNEEYAPHKGWFTRGGQRLKTWSDGQWQTLHTYSWDDDPLHLVGHRADDLYVYGDFDTFEGETVGNLAHWDGSGWKQVSGTNIPPEPLSSLQTGANGSIYAVYAFWNYETAENEDCVARWDGAAWQQVSPPLEEVNWYTRDRLLGVDGLGRAYVIRGDGSQKRLLRPSADGLLWETLGTFEHAEDDAHLDSIAFPVQGGVYVAGRFSAVDGDEAIHNVTYWNEASWAPVGRGSVSRVHALAVDDTGKLYAAGFRLTEDAEVRNDPVATWDGTQWSYLGSSEDLFVHRRSTALSLDNGGVFYSQISSSSSYRELRHWNGQRWETLPSRTPIIDPLGRPLYTERVSGYADTERLVAGFGAARQVLHHAIPEIEAMAFDGDGRLYLTGDFEGIDEVVSPYFIALDFPANSNPSFVDDSQYRGVSVTGVQVPTGTLEADLDYLLRVTDGDVGQSLTWSVVVPPSHGQLHGFPATATSNGLAVLPSGLRFSVPVGFAGKDSFTVRISDGTTSDIMRVPVEVTTAPRFVADADNDGVADEVIVIDEASGPVDISDVLTVHDPDSGQSLRWELPLSNPSVEGLPQDRQSNGAEVNLKGVTYEPPPGLTGSIQVTCAVYDGTYETVLTVAIEVVPRVYPPRFVYDADDDGICDREFVSTLEDGREFISDLLRVEDLNVGETLSWTLEMIFLEGLVSFDRSRINSNGREVAPYASYTPFSGAVGDFALVFRVSDGTYSDWMVLPVKIRDKPNFTNPLPTTIYLMDGELGVPLDELFAVTDADVGETITWEVEYQDFDELLSGFPASASSTGDSVKPPGTAYQFPSVPWFEGDYVRITISDGTYDTSAYVTFRLGLPQPELLEAKVLPKGHVQLSWLDHSTMETMFFIERQEVGHRSWRLAGRAAGNTTTWIDDDPPSNADVAYRLRAARSYEQLVLDTLLPISNEPDYFGTKWGVTDLDAHTGETCFRASPIPRHPVSFIAYCAGPGRLSFWWKLDAPRRLGAGLSWRIGWQGDRTYQHEPIDWQRIELEIPPGNHPVIVGMGRSVSTPWGGTADPPATGYVDNVQFTPAASASGNH